MNHLSRKDLHFNISDIRDRLGNEAFILTCINVVNDTSTIK